MLYLITALFIIISVLLVWFLVKHDRGPKEPMSALWVAFGFGILALVLSILLELLLPSLDLQAKNAPLFAVLLYALGIGFIEEGAKFLPLSLFIYKRKYFNEHNDGIIYFAICGLTFGFFENFFYTFGTASVSVGIVRLILTPIFHASSTAIIGYFLARKKVENKSWFSVILALAIVSIIHAIYNFGLYSAIAQLMVISLLMTVLLTTGLFVLLWLANTKDREEGISASHNYKFCPSCGTKNSHHSVFCEYCGFKL